MDIFALSSKRENFISLGNSNNFFPGEVQKEKAPCIKALSEIIWTVMPNN